MPEDLRALGETTAESSSNMEKLLYTVAEVEEPAGPEEDKAV